MTITSPQDKLLLHDRDGTPLAFVTRDYAERVSPGCVETHDGRLVHKDSADAAKAARNAEFWDDVRTMDEPAGIRSSLA